MNFYRLRQKRYYARILGQSTNRLFNHAWRIYRAWLRGSIDDPRCDDDVILWLEAIMADAVNDSESQFFIYG